MVRHVSVRLQEFDRDLPIVLGVLRELDGRRIAATSRPAANFAIVGISRTGLGARCQMCARA
jgi:hypothetical protein